MSPEKKEFIRLLHACGLWPLVEQGTSSGSASDAWPIDSVFISMSSADPATQLGFGTWQSLGAGFALVTVDAGDAAIDAAGKTTGAKTVAAAGTVSQPTFTGSANQASSAVSAGTPAGTVTWPASVPAFSGSSGNVPAQTISWPGGVPTFSGNAGTVPAGTLSWPAGVPTFTGSALAAHFHELPLQLVSGTSIRHLPAATFGTGTSRAAQGGVAPTANTTSAAVALSESKSAGTPAGTIAWPAAVPTITTVSFTPAGTIAWPAGVPTNGAVSFTPAGTIAWPAAAPGFSGNALGTHSHTLTPAGTVSQPTFTGNATSVVQPSIAVYAWRRTA